MGRERELAQVSGFLATHRLVTLTGAGGVGKTRLALQVAAGLVGSYRDGVWLIDLAGLRDASLVPHAIAGGTGVFEESGRAMAETLADHLRPRQILLVLDNCEHLIAACAATVADLLRRCPGVRVLATSREALNVGGEIVWLVPSLPVGSPTAEGVRLFLERASAALPSSTTADWNIGTVQEICRRLDGIPLAIELAATRVRALSVEQIADGLDDRFRLLDRGARTASPRQRTLRALIDWSYDLLSEQERALLRRLSVFAGGWSMQASEEVCVGDPLDHGAVRDLLTQLVERSLVVAEPVRDEYRYRLLENLRQYAGEKLLASGEAAAVRTRHLAYFVRLAEPGYGDSPQAGSLRMVAHDLDNIRAALSWSLEDGSVLMGLRLAAAVGTRWNVAGHPTEGRGWLATMLQHAPADATDDVWTAARARALAATGYLACIVGDLSTADAPLQAALQLWQELGNRRQASFCLRWLGRLAVLQGQPEVARAHLEAALSIAREIGHPAAIYEALHALGVAANDEDRRDRAAALFEEALALARERNDAVWTYLCAVNLGALALERGDLDSAHRWLTQGLAMAPRNEGWIGQILEVAAGVAAAEARPERALRLAGAAAALRQRAGTLLPERIVRLIQRRIEATRRSTPPEPRDRFWAEGRAMGLAAAVEYALPAPHAVVGTSDAAGELTAREREVVVLLARGLTNRQIAGRLFLSPGTVKRHIENILTKLDLDSRSQVAAWAAQSGLLDEAPVG